MLEAKRYDDNPIISPRSNNPWETNGTFNPTAIELKNKVFIIYRQISWNNVSTFGLAISSDGFSIDDRLEHPIYVPRKSFEVHPDVQNSLIKTKVRKERINIKYLSGSSYFGVEDPRIVEIDRKLYLTYVAFNGIEPPRIALSWIKTKDFLKERWDKWSEPILISHPSIPDKSCIIFPEKIKGKYLFFHRIFPYIWADYIKNFEEFKNGRFIFGRPVIKTRPKYWDSRKIGPGATPIKWKKYWILVYYGVSGWDDWFYNEGLRPEDFKVNDGYKYKGSVMLLDEENPEKVVYVPDEALLVPETWYELDAVMKPNVIYPTGAVIRKNQLIIYYGASDYHVAVATLDLNLLEEEIENAQEASRKPDFVSKSKKLVGSKSRAKSFRYKIWKKILNALQKHYRSSPKKYKRLY